jgi:hypothetical protein
MSQSGNRLQVIENLGMTQDEYEAIDLSDNEITVVENFPVLKRLLSLFVCNNHVKLVQEGIKVKQKTKKFVLLKKKKSGASSFGNSGADKQ